MKGITVFINEFVYKYENAISDTQNIQEKLCHNSGDSLAFGKQN